MFRRIGDKFPGAVLRSCMHVARKSHTSCSDRDACHLWWRKRFWPLPARCQRRDSCTSV